MSLEPQVAVQAKPARSTATIKVTRFSGDHSATDRQQPEVDLVAVEEPLELRIAYGPRNDRKLKSLSVTMRTPGNDFELVAGFLLTEGIVSDPSDIETMQYLAGGSHETTAEDLVLPYQPERNTVLVELDPALVVNLGTLERNFYTTSSCGICGKASLLALRTVCPARSVNRITVDAETLYLLPQKLRKAQSVFDQTGGLHGAGLFDVEGNLISLLEDVGRHNAVDKVIGRHFLAEQVPLRNRILLLSGRASFELLQKALMAGIQMVVSVGAPSSLAVTVAREFDIVLAGFLREKHFNVYHGAGHIRTSTDASVVLSKRTSA